jgi:dipeptidyl aminopeptidase/acylaminoacyl peptidase
MTKPFTSDDLCLFNDLGQLDASSVRQCAACVVRTVDLENDGYASSIWTFAADGSQARRLTPGPGDNAPRWSPDGQTLAFVSTRDGAPQVYLLPMGGGEAQPLTRLPSGVSQFQWSPDGRRLLVCGAVPVDPETREQRRVGDSRPPDSPELAWRLPYKTDGNGYTLARAFVLFVVDVKTGEATQVTPSSFDVMAMEWSPDGKRIAYTRTRPGREAHRTDLWTANNDGSVPRQLTRDLATVMSPRWSPDGRRIAITGAREEGDALSRLFLVDAADGSVTLLGSDDMDVGSPESLRWRPDSSALVLIVASRACQVIASISVPGGERTDLVQGERHISELALAGDRLYYFSESAAVPRELFTCAIGGEEKQLSQLNAWWWERTPLEVQLRTFRVPDGSGGEETIEGWLVRAKDAPVPQPLLVEAHGGPNAFALLGFPWNTYWNTLCSRGWAVVVPHAVGSSTFGRRFAERLNGHWGELDFPQFMAAIDQLQDEGLASDQLVIAGKSYGGYMSAWAIGHTERFKAAIVAAPVANLESHFGTSDGGYYGQPYVLNAERHIDPETYRRLSPVTHIHKAKTPTLILQGKEDERCPRGQAEELFAVLRRVGQCECELVMYPGGDHHLYENGKPSHRLDVVRRMADWIERWAA